MKKLLVDNKKYNMLDIIIISFKCSKVYSILYIVNIIINSIIPTLQIIFIGLFIDNTIAILSSNGTVDQIILPIIYIASLLLYQHGISPLMYFVNIRHSMELMKKLRFEFIQRRGMLEYKHMEDTKTHDVIQRVAEEPEKLVMGIFKDIIDLLSLILKIAGIITVMAIYVWWIALLIVLVSIPLYYLAIKSGKATYKTKTMVTKLKRKYEYIGELLTSRYAVDERTLFNYGEKINNDWLRDYETARKQQYKTEKKWFIKMKSSGIFTAFICIFILFILLTQALNGTISIGMYIALVNTTFNLVSAMSWQLAQIIDKMVKNREKLKDLTKFMSLTIEQNSIKKSSEPFEFRTMEFRNVRFKYPTSNKYTLKGISFIIESGKHYSFVGANGSGKTTIVKLMIGLYKEFEGDILINGISIKEYGQDVINSIYSVVFQDFAKYSLSIRDNVRIGDINNTSDDTDIKIYDYYKMLNSSMLDQLEKGLDTQLGKLYDDGLDISKGEWQKTAIARALYNQATIRLLDEPTASLDPITESDIFKNFKKISEGFTTIFISHRLASTKSSDLIYVLKDGVIIEKDNHVNLMNNKKDYYKMYDSQRSWYL